jgi:N-acetylmuramoyl-L-alanine amidase
MRLTILTFISLMLFVQQGFAAIKIEGVRVWPAPDNTRIVFDVSDRVEHKIFSLENPDRLVIDISDIAANPRIETLNRPTKMIKRVRHAVREGGGLRVVLDLTQKIKPRSFVLPANKKYGNRLVIDLYPELRESAAKPSQPIKDISDQRRDLIVVIDAGHGGEDPGALGPHGIREKTVVLAIAKELQLLFDRQRGFKAKMVRTGDYYVGLHTRTQRARKMNADIFVSIHADAFKSPKAKGASVYTLSQRGASSEAAKWLANSENNADLVGGVGGVSLGEKDSMLAGVLLDLSQAASMRAGVSTGRQVLSELGKITKLHKRQVEKAGFVVLKSPDVPSILVETGFISNPGEAKKLNSKAHQRRVARAIFNGVKGYFSNTPPQGTYLAWEKSNRGSVKKYRIAQGDTLSGIAVRNNTSLSKIKKLNQMTSNKIKVGQVIRIPAS